MALSEQEQRLLDEMERNLYSNEADVVSTTPSEQLSVSPTMVVNTILALALGLGVIVLGLVLGQPLIGIAGFVVIVAGVFWALSSSTGTPHSERKNGAGPKPKSPSSTGAGGQSFMQRMESRWERRQDGSN